MCIIKLYRTRHSEIMKKALIIFLELSGIVLAFLFTLYLLPDSFYEFSNNKSCEVTPDTNNYDDVKKDFDNRFLLHLGQCPKMNEKLLIIQHIQFKKIQVNAISHDFKSEDIPSISSEINSRFPVFYIPEQVDSIEIYVQSSVKQPLKFHLTEKQDYIFLNHSAHVFYAFIFGSFITIFVFNFLIYFRSGDKDYGSYLPFLVFNILFLLFSEGVYRYIDITWLEILRNNAIWLFAACPVYFANRFIVRFTKLDLYFPNFVYFGLNLPATLCLIFGILSVFEQKMFQGPIQILSLWLALVTLPALIPLVKKHSFSIEYVISAWSIIVVAIVFRVGYGLGILPISGMVIYGVIIASLFESLLLSLALGNKLVKSKNRELRLYERAITDELTEINNLRGLKAKGAAIFRNSQLFGTDTQVALLDIDHFKKINDKFGHQAGDIVLKTLVQRINNMLREEDLFGRYGGEEFLVLLPETSYSDSKKILSRISKSIHQQKVTFDSQDIKVSISVGLTSIISSDSTLDDCIARADKALYLAKENGRNRIESILSDND